MRKGNSGLAGIYIALITIIILLGISISFSKADKRQNLQANNSESIQAMEAYKDPVVSVNSDKTACDISAEQEHLKEWGIDDAVIENLKLSQKGYYCYDLLNPEEQTLYAEVLITLNKHADDIMVSTDNSDELEYIFKCVFYDHPEIYWIDGYSYSRHVKNGEIAYLTFGGNYIYTENQCKEFDNKIKGYVSLCLGGISDFASDYEKVKYVYEYIIRNTDYELASNNNQNILSVFLEGKSVCQGYAKAAQYLLQQLDVQCTLVVGSSVKGDGHAWNLVNIDNTYYYFDVTWGDSSFEGNERLSDIEINYNFLNITTEELNKTHVINMLVTMPRCIETRANYYVMEGLFFDAYDSVKIGRAFDTAYNKGNKTVALKCSDEAVYESMLYNLIDKQEVFKYLKTDTMTYCGDIDNCLIIVFL